MSVPNPAEGEVHVCCQGFPQSDEGLSSGGGGCNSKVRGAKLKVAEAKIGALNGIRSSQTKMSCSPTKDSRRFV
jgi:hypothetical protein